MVMNTDFILEKGYDAQKLLLVTYFDKAVKRKICLKWIAEELGIHIKSGAGRSLDVIRKNLKSLQSDGVLTIQGDIDYRCTSTLVVSINEEHPLFTSYGKCLQVDSEVLLNQVTTQKKPYRAYSRWLAEQIAKDDEEEHELYRKFAGLEE